MTAIDAISSDSSQAANPAVIDHSYSFRDTKTGPNQGVGTMGFDDFLDMVNPLQHIPVVSSIYRAVTGDTINPVARIAGDALYGGVLGLASAGISALGAVADEAFAALNDGKSASSTVVAALFGDDGDKDSGDTQLAANDTSASPVQTAGAAPMKAAALQTPSALQSPILQMPDLSSVTTQVASAQAASAAATSTTTSTPSSVADAIESGKGLALDRSKQPYGGVMDTSMMQNAEQNQALALALVSGQNNLQAQHALRNSRFSTSAASTVTSPTAQSAALPLPGTVPMASLTPTSAAANANNANAAINPAQALAAQYQNVPQTTAAASTAQALPASLRQSIPQSTGNLSAAIKGLDQYRSTAQRVPVMGMSLDIAN